MIYQGQALSVDVIDAGKHKIAQLNFDRQDQTINKFDQLTLSELRSAVEAVKKADDLQGLMITSSKEAFIVGADITEFQTLFKNEED